MVRYNYANIVCTFVAAAQAEKHKSAIKCYFFSSQLQKLYTEIEFYE
jgi:hypothetical protein